MTREQARRFILSKQGLLGKYRFVGKSGAYQYIRQAGCIQYDPVDVCGKNAELTLQSCVRGFTRKMLADLLYKDRLLVDYTDKELSIWPRRCRFSTYSRTGRTGCCLHSREWSGKQWHFSDSGKSVLAFLYALERKLARNITGSPIGSGTVIYRWRFADPS